MLVYSRCVSILFGEKTHLYESAAGSPDEFPEEHEYWFLGYTRYIVMMAGWFLRIVGFFCKFQAR